MLGALRGLAIVVAVVAAAVSLGVYPDVPAPELEQRYATPASQFVAVDGTRVHYQLHAGDNAGDAPVVLLVHGTASSLFTYDAWTPALVAAGYRVLLLDLPAFGLTGPAAAADFAYTVVEYADFVASVCAAVLGDGVPVRVAGNSLGGHIAWTLAWRHPDVVAAVVLIDASGGFPRSSGPPLTFRAAQLPGTRPLFRWFTPRWLIKRNLHQVYANASLVSDALVDRHWLMTRREGSRDALLARVAAMATEAVHAAAETPAVAALTQPTLVLWGAADRWVPLQHGQLYADTIPNARLAVLPGLGHVPQEEAPDVSLRPVLEFLATVE